MNLNILAPYIRVQVFGLVIAVLAQLGLPAELAGAWTDALTVILMLILSTAYGAYASWRDSKAKLVDRTAALAQADSGVARALAAKVDTLVNLPRELQT